MDQDTRSHFYIASSLLENPSFDLVSWFLWKWGQLKLFWLGLGKRDVLCPEAHLFVSCPTPGDVATNLHSVEPEDSDEDYPDLVPLSDSEGSEDGDEFPLDNFFEFDNRSEDTLDEESGEVIADRLADVLTFCQPFPGDSPPVDLRYREGDACFIVEQGDAEIFTVFNRVQGFEALIHVNLL